METSHKTVTTTNGNYFFNNLSTPLLLWLRKLKSFSLRHLLSSQLEPQFYSALQMALAHPVTQRSRVVFLELVSNTRHIIGGGLVVVGCASGMLYHLFDPLVINKEWYFLNWYYFLYTIREELTIGFWAVGMFLLLPTKYKLAFVPSTIMLAYSLSNIVNYYFFVDSLASFHADIHYTIIVASVSAALGIIISADYLCYRKYHLKDGNLARINGVLQLKNLSDEEKVKHLNAQMEERLNYNARI